MLVLTVRTLKLERSRRPAEKNQTLSRKIGPPNVPSRNFDKVSGFVWLRDFWSGDSLDQDGLLKFIRTLPENVLPPRLVTMLITPPENRPYSAEIPDVITCVSSIASSMKTLFAVPNRLSLRSTPSMRNTLS